MANIDLSASKLVEIAESQLSSSYAWHNRMLWKVAEIKIPFDSVFQFHPSDFYGDSEYSSVPYNVQLQVYTRQRKNYNHDINAIIKAAKKLRPGWTIGQYASHPVLGAGSACYDTFLITVRQLR